MIVFSYGIFDTMSTQPSHVSRMFPQPVLSPCAPAPASAPEPLPTARAIPADPPLALSPNVIVTFMTPRAGSPSNAFDKKAASRCLFA